MGEIVVDSDCRFTLTVGLAAVVVAGVNAELTSSTVLEAALAVLAFAVAAACFALASTIAALAASILCSAFEVVVSGDAGVVSVGPAVASHSSSMVAAPDVTLLKQYSLVSGAPSL